MTFWAILGIATALVLGVAGVVTLITFSIMMIVDILDEVRFIAARMIAKRR